MRRCPTCDAEFADNHDYCLHDGAALVPDSPLPGPPTTVAGNEEDTLIDTLLLKYESEPEHTAVEGKEVDSQRARSARFDEETGAQSLEKHCPRCNRLYAASYAFCLKDGTPLIEAGAPQGTAQTTTELIAPTPRESPVGSVSPAPPMQGARHPGERKRPPERHRSAKSKSTNKRRLALWGGLGLLAVVALAGVIYLLTRPPALEGQTREALQQGHLVHPIGTSAYDFYQQFEAEHPGDAGLESLAEEALPLLRAELDDFFARWYATSEASDSDWERADRLSEWAGTLNSGEPRFRAYMAYARGRLAFLSGDHEGAISRYQDASAAWPEWALPYNSIGVIHARTHDYQEALRWYSRASGRDPDWSFPLGNMGGAYVRMERWREAEAALGRAVSLDGERPYPHALLSQVYLQLRQYRNAQQAAQRALALDSYGTSGFDAERLRKRVEYIDGYLDHGYSSYMTYQEYASRAERGSVLIEGLTDGYIPD